MAQYVYSLATGALFSWTPGDTDPVASAQVLAADGLAVVSGLPPLDATHVWDSATRTVDTVTAPPPEVWIETYKFILLFTPAEHGVIVASTDQKVQQFLMALTTSPQVNLNDPIVTGGVNYLVTAGLLTQANAALILSGQPSQ